MKASHFMLVQAFKQEITLRKFENALLDSGNLVIIKYTSCKSKYPFQYNPQEGSIASTFSALSGLVTCLAASPHTTLLFSSIIVYVSHSGTKWFLCGYVLPSCTSQVWGSFNTPSISSCHVLRRNEPNVL